MRATYEREVSLAGAAERYPAVQLAWARAALGAYLATFFFWLAPHADALCSAAGVFDERPATGFPNAMAALEPWAGGYGAFCVALGGLALLYAAGLGRRVLAVLLWYGYACIHERISFAAVPQGPFIGWLVLATALVPPGEPTLWRGARPGWRMPTAFLVAAWTVLAVAYTASGLSKLASPSFLSGDAIAQILASPIGRRWWGTSLLEAWPIVPALLTWATVAVEIAFAPLCVLAWGRAAAWLVMSLMHVGIVLTLGIADVPIGMLVFHLFVLDRAWLDAAARAFSRVRAGARAAPLAARS